LSVPGEKWLNKSGNSKLPVGLTDYLRFLHLGATENLRRLLMKIRHIVSMNYEALDFINASTCGMPPET
jgi:hypothetical protein